MQMDGAQSNVQFIYIQQKVPLHTWQLLLLATMGSGCIMHYGSIFTERAVSGALARKGCMRGQGWHPTAHATLLSCEVGAMTCHRKVKQCLCVCVRLIHTRS